jgi:hypothetical protein
LESSSQSVLINTPSVCNPVCRVDASPAIDNVPRREDQARRILHFTPAIMELWEKSETIDPDVRAYVESLVTALGGRSTYDDSYGIHIHETLNTNTG